MNYIKKWLAGFLLFASLSSMGQDVHFSQYYRVPLMVNPALTGVFPGDHRAVVNYRDQWAGLAPFKTYGLSYDAAILRKKLNNKFLGVGLMAFKDKAGDTHLSTTQVSLSVSSVITINDKQDISAGLQGGFAQKGIDAGSLQWGEEYEENIGYQPGTGTVINYENFTFGDFAAGLAWSYSNSETNISSNDQISANAGVAIYHLNKPEQLFDEEVLHMQLVAHAGATIGIKGTPLAIAPSVLFLSQGPLKQVNVGSLVRYTLKEQSKYTGLLKETALYLGCYYRIGDAVIPTMLFEMASYSIGFSYDVNTSGLKDATSGKGGFEISLRFINPNPFNNTRYKHKGLL